MINTPDGVWVSSENGVAADNWHPHLSKIPGLRKEAEFMGREVILNSNTLEDSIDQYDSMVKEKALADPNRADPRWMNVFPSSELPPWRRQWPVVPSFTYGGINYGTIADDRLAPMFAVVSLDATDPARLDRLVAEGRMPNLAGLRERGRAHRVRGAAPARADGAGHLLHARDGGAGRAPRPLPAVRVGPGRDADAAGRAAGAPALWDRMAAAGLRSLVIDAYEIPAPDLDRRRLRPRAAAPQPRVGPACRPPARARPRERAAPWGGRPC